MPGEPALIAGRYRLGRVLGRGGMSTVHEAEDLRLGRSVAIKRFAATGEPATADRLRREARLLAGLAHPNLVAVFDAGFDETSGGWIALELVPGPDLAALLRASGRQDGEVARRVVHDVAGALAYIHGRGVVHRDLKPANVLLTSEPGNAPWQARLADFGIARLLEDERLTATGTVIGTAAYLSPEQTRGEAVGTASDVYSLGLVALEVLTGERPFPGSAVESATTRLVRGPTMPDWIGEPWATLLATMTAADPAARPSAAQVGRAVSTPLPAVQPPTRRAAAPEVPTELVPTELATAVLPPPARTTATVPVASVPARRERGGRLGRRLAPVGGAIAAGAVALAIGGALVSGTAPGPSRTPSAITAHASPVPSAAPVRAATPSARATAVASSTRPRQATRYAGTARGAHGKGHGKQKGKGRG